MLLSLACQTHLVVLRSVHEGECVLCCAVCVVVRVLACLPLAFLLAANQCGQTGMWPRCAHVRHDKAQNTKVSVRYILHVLQQQAGGQLNSASHLHVQRTTLRLYTLFGIYQRESFSLSRFQFSCSQNCKELFPLPPALCESCGPHPSLPPCSAVTLPWAYLYFKYPKLLLIMRRGRGRKKVFVRSVFALFFLSFFFRVSLDSPE